MRPGCLRPAPSSAPTSGTPDSVPPNPPSSSWACVPLTPSNPEALPWTANYLLPGGIPVDVLAFRVGDTYRITPEGDKLNMRAATSLNASLVYQLQTGDYVIIVDGPTQAAGFTWWKLELAMDPSVSAWAVENPAWYERAWGQ